ncbi:M20/M25/M40 family metallo-hydrolase [Phocicoccus pinnipedialis]|uniref:Succinyl-diaminopimelate desuccinylase n=1 Tax=Phocicoccus pinnipedialis TaxID=110845 RepID=A0A6V7REA7_9BACL|nr:M20/M25/M40 family metallo-hydrolase [Jeotgalicoccus pinnipedialis]MBP1939267.1 arginine utilization protein RocB [Jeotgalicoccus pinnipedialis]CAD2076090.1 Succinyl-diaminopimelate desuccinylase [Jeotgalicoccus pinnipedialis]
MELWQTSVDRENLLKQFVLHDTITHSKGEKSFVDLVKNNLEQLPYFRQQDRIQFAHTDDDRRALIAHYEGKTSKDTIVLISHFDTVGVDDYAEYKEYAFDTDKITEHFKKDNSYLDNDAIKDLNSNEYLFGRGVMDMKPGLMLHMSLIEKAIIEEWDINLVLVTVPDEEVGSKGMLAAIDTLKELKERKNLNIRLHLNSEPTFQQEGSDTNHYVYSGTIGKIMPGVFVYGLETHVGNALNGISSNYIMSYINQSLEYNPLFIENFKDEITPPLVSLYMRDIKDHYDVQTPFKTVSLYNAFIFNRNAEEVFETFNSVVEKAVESCTTVLNEQFDTGFYAGGVSVPVITYSELYVKAVNELGRETVETIINQAEQKVTESHMKSVQIVDDLMTVMRSIGPAVITFYTPPYYPAANSSDDLDVKLAVSEVIRSASELGRISEEVRYFNGICDLSYVQYTSNNLSDAVYEENTPSFGRSYSIPFDSIREISAPIINIGPIGKDAHKVSERVLKKSAFSELPYILESVIQNCYIKNRDV